jgi:putative phosphoesterase
MIVGLISDSHENMPLIRKAVEYLNKNKVDIVLHAGDIISPITAKEFEKLNSKMIAVFGNNDGEKKMWRERIQNIGEIHDTPFELTIEGKKILLTHSPENLKALAESNKYDIIVYGHTHKPDNRMVRKTLVVNPGELGGWLYGKSTVALLRIPELKAEILELH